MNVVPELLIGAHAAVTLFMVGVIWFVQVVHYPLFARVGSGYATYQIEHMRRTGWVVIPPMLAEAGLVFLITVGSLLPLGFDTSLSPVGASVGAGLLAVVWGSTFFVQVPLHERLARGFDAELAGQLVRGNWIRTLAWTGRGLLALVWLLAR